MSTLVSVAAAVAGAARYKLGEFLLAVFVRLNQKLPAEELFTSAWRFVRRFDWLFRGREFAGNRYQIDWQNFAFMKLLGLVNSRGRHIGPGLHVLNDASLMELAAERAPTVVVTIHSRIEYVLNRVLEERGIEYSVIAISRGAQRASELLGLKGRIDLIPLSGDTLLLARKKLRDGKFVATSVDFTVREQGTLYHDKYVAESLFGFASERGARLLYAHTSVSEDGNVIVRLSRPRIDEAQSSPRALANDFVDFVAALAVEPSQWKVGPWTLRTRSEINQCDNFWVRRRGRAG